jgi:hypothetical protein
MRILLGYCRQKHVRMADGCEPLAILAGGWPIVLVSRGANPSDQTGVDPKGPLASVGFR